MVPPAGCTAGGGLGSGGPGEGTREAAGHPAYSEGVSDLQCAARLYIARHGDADDPGNEAAADAVALTDEGVRRVHELAAQLRPVRISAVCSSSARVALESAQVAG
jgi:hypothetical protein